MDKIKLRDYQKNAIKRVEEHMKTHNKGLVKMFCGTGKSIIMVKVVEYFRKNLSVYVFPSLALIDQFNRDYVKKYKSGENVLIVCSEIDSSKTTTDEEKIKQFLKVSKRKIILVTYQSFNVLLDSLGDHKINICCFDEAHHAVGDENQKLIFNNDSIEKQLFFTATPKNANGIIMHDFNRVKESDCGNLIYDYSYYSGCNDEYFNPFEIRIDMYLEDTNKSIYESIARAIITTGNSRVLTFHGSVSESNSSKTSVRSFVDYSKFIEAFNYVLEKEFYDQYEKWSTVDITFVGIDAKTKNRSKILKQFEECKDDQIYVLSSCETIGEGIDTKNANICVFVDPKTSYVKIIQNIGRIVRIKEGEEIPNSTVLIPCWVDKSKYEESSDDKEKQDEVIRNDMQKGGNFNGILNVMSALKQEDEELFNQCLCYPDVFSYNEIQKNLNKQGFEIIEDFEENDEISCLEYLLDDDINLDETDLEENIFMEISKDKAIIIEVHNNSLETPIEVYGKGKGKDKIRIYKSDDEEYFPIVKKKGSVKKSKNNIKPPSKKKGFSFNIHTSDEIKVLWSVKNDLDITKNISSCVIDCDVIAYDPMEVAKAIVKRAYEREKKGGRLLPRNIANKKNRTIEQLEQEHKDATKLGNWKSALKGKGKGKGKCSDEVRDYLDEKLLGWRDEIDFDEKAMEDAKAIVKRACKREKKGGRLLPRVIREKEKRTTEELKQEHKDAQKLGDWKKALKGKGKCSDEVRDYLDINLLGWRDEIDKKAIQDAQSIVQRAYGREKICGRLLPRYIANKKNRTTEQLKQEHKDAQKLGEWKKALKGKGKCSDEVRDYLDEKLLGWRDEIDFDEKAMENAKAIVKRACEREKKGGRLLPRNIANKKNRTTEQLKQEHKDAKKLGKWKSALKDKGDCKCSDEVRDYLDINLLGWRDEIDKKAIQDAQSIVQRAYGREKICGRLLPRYINDKKKRTTKELEEEYKDAIKLCNWKKALKGKGKCSDEVRDYLDINLPGWRDEIDEKAMEDAKAIVKRACEREKKGGRLLPRVIKKEKRTTEQLEREYKDGLKLRYWKYALKGKTKGNYKCSDEVRDYLDEKLLGWRDEIDFDEKAMEDAKAIVERAYEREKKGKRLLPRELDIKNRTTEKLKQEYKDALKLRCWKYALKGSKNWKCSDEVKNYLDQYLPHWRPDWKPIVEISLVTKDITPDEITTKKVIVKKSKIIKKKSMKLKSDIPKELLTEEPVEEKQKRIKSELSTLHQKYKTYSSNNLHKIFTKDPELWKEYHAISEENEKSFPKEKIPRNKIIKLLDETPHKREQLIVDLGCGKAEISKYFENDDRYKFINYDHYAFDESVEKVNIKSLPLEDGSVDICILSLAMWGSDCSKYIEEVYRVLDTRGMLYIIEPSKRWTEIEVSDKLEKLINDNDFTIIRKQIGKFTLLECLKY